MLTMQDSSEEGEEEEEEGMQVEAQVAAANTDVLLKAEWIVAALEPVRDTQQFYTLKQI